MDKPHDLDPAARALLVRRYSEKHVAALMRQAKQGRRGPALVLGEVSRRVAALRAARAAGQDRPA